MNIEKLVNEYKEKIAEYEAEIEFQKRTQSERRKALGRAAELFNDSTYIVSKQRQIHDEAKRQCYLQFIADLESID